MNYFFKKFLIQIIYSEKSIIYFIKFALKSIEKNFYNISIEKYLYTPIFTFFPG